MSTCRRLECWDLATEALIRARREAVRRKDAGRRYDLDRHLGLLYLDREQYGNALLRFQACLQHARRQSDGVEAVVNLSALVARCQAETGDGGRVKRTHRALLDYLKRSKERRAIVNKEPALSLVVGRAYLAQGMSTEAKQLRARMRRLKGLAAKEAVAALDRDIETAQGS